MRFKCNTQTDIQMTFRGGSQTTPLVIQLGRVDKFKKGEKKHPNLIERQSEAAKNPALEKAKQAQKLHMSLPRVSASGRECDAVQLGPDLAPIRTSLDSVNATLRSISKGIHIYTYMYTYTYIYTYVYIQLGVCMYCRTDLGSNTAPLGAALRP